MKIFIADDHSLFRDGLKHVLNALDTEVSVGEAETLDQLIGLLEESADADLIVLDLSMPGMDGARSIAAVRALAGGAPIVVISASEDRNDVISALEAGVAGYIPKSVRGQVMLSALRLVMVGGIYVPPLILGAENLAAPRGPNTNGMNTSIGHAKLRSILTERQIDVLRLLAEGRPNKEIARQLNLAEGTVRVHVNAVLKALSARNRTEAALTARNSGLL